MAKKTSKSSNVTTNYGVIKVTAFWGIIISGIAGIITFVFKCLVRWNVVGGAGTALATLVGVLNLIANLSLFVCVFLAAYAHSKGQKKLFRILFWVFAVLTLLSILGFNIVSMI